MIKCQADLAFIEQEARLLSWKRSLIAVQIVTYLQLLIVAISAFYFFATKRDKKKPTFVIVIYLLLLLDAVFKLSLIVLVYHDNRNGKTTYITN